MATEATKESAATLDDLAECPFLRRVRIRGYKSIAFCDVALTPLTVLVGRNASGKSNFLDALASLSDLMKMRVSEAVNERRGWGSVHCRNAHSACIEMALETSFGSDRSMWDANYSFVLESATQKQIRVRREHLVLTEQGGKRECGFVVENGERRWIGAEHFLPG